MSIMNDEDFKRLNEEIRDLDIISSVPSSWAPSPEPWEFNCSPELDEYKNMFDKGTCSHSISVSQSWLRAVCEYKFGRVFGLNWLSVSGTDKFTILIHWLGKGIRIGVSTKDNSS